MENRTNFTISCYENQDANYWKTINTIFIVFCSLCSVLGTVGNGLVIFITGFRLKKTVHTVWILNLAIADFTVSLFLPFTIVYIGLGFHWPFGPIMCKLQEAIVFLNLFASVYLLVAISVDRCSILWCPVWAQNHRTPQLASFVVLGVWILALMLSFPDICFKESHNNDESNTTSCSYNYTTMEKEGVLYPLTLLQFMFGFIIPFSVIAVCYGAIVVRLRRHQLSQSSRPLKVITAVIVAFFVCWFPFHVFTFFEMNTKHGSNNYQVVIGGFRLSYSLTFFNSCLNPILYFCLGHKKLRCSLLSVFANAFTEDSNHSTKYAKTRSTAEPESLKF